MGFLIRSKLLKPRINAASVANNAIYLDTYNGDNTASLLEHFAGDFFVACAMRDNSSTAPTLPAGWNSILSGGANTLGAVIAWKRAVGSSETVGTFGNATSLQIQHFRPGAGWTIGAGAVNTSSSSSNVALSCPGVTLQNTNGTSRLVAFYMHRNADIAGLTTPPAGLLFCEPNQDAVDTMAAYRSDGVISSWTTRTVSFTGTPSAVRWLALELTVTQ